MLSYRLGDKYERENRCSRIYTQGKGSHIKGVPASSFNPGGVDTPICRALS